MRAFHNLLLKIKRFEHGPHKLFTGIVSVYSILYSIRVFILYFNYFKTASITEMLNQQLHRYISS